MDLIPRLEEIKEDVKEINEADILEAANIPKERAKLRKAQLQAQAAIKDPPLSPVDGTGVPSEETQGPTWKVWGGGGEELLRRKMGEGRETGEPAGALVTGDPMMGYKGEVPPKRGTLFRLELYKREKGREFTS